MSYKVNAARARSAYGMSAVQEEALIARNSQDSDEQLRIAKGSKNRLVLSNLALNRNLDSKTVDALFDRDLSYVSKRLSNMGHEKSAWYK